MDIAHKAQYVGTEDGFIGGLCIRVRGHSKIMAHLLFGILALTVDQLMRYVARASNDYAPLLVNGVQALRQDRWILRIKRNT